METRRTRFLPKALAVELRRLPWRVLGASLVGIAVACWLALISWSYADPTPNYVTSAQPHNWLGARGARIADDLMHGFGLASPFLVLPLAALGLRIAGGNLPLRPRLRAAYWVAACLTLPAFFAMFPATPRWVLDTGLGGMVGDFAASRVAKLSHAIPSALLWPAFALLFLPAGAWFTFRACGFSAKALSLVIGRGSASTESAAGFEMPPVEAAEEKLVNKATSWVKRFALKERALTVISQPREYWMTVARTEPSLTPAKMEKSGAQGLATRGEAAASTPSPFANWGSRRSESRRLRQRLRRRKTWPLSRRSLPAKRNASAKQRRNRKSSRISASNPSSVLGARRTAPQALADRMARPPKRLRRCAVSPAWRLKAPGMARSASWRTAPPCRPPPLRAAGRSFTRRKPRPRLSR